MSTLRNGAKKELMLMVGVGIGATGTYLLDPDRGKLRRALFRDRATHAWKTLRIAGGKATKDAGNRAMGIVAEALSAARPEEASNDVLVARVRAKLGHLVSYPSLVHVRAEEGTVTLTGDILESEAGEVARVISALPGIAGLHNRLLAWKEPDDIPGFHPGTLHRGLAQANQSRWTPSKRLMTAGAGGLLTLYGANRRGLWGLITGSLGVGMMIRSVTNRDVKGLLGFGEEGIGIQKTITINAPISDLFQFWANPENYPRVMSHVHEVKKVGENRYHWKVASPGGTTGEWEGEITRVIPNELVAWRSLPGSLVPNSGVVRLDPNYNATTRVQIRMSYQPPAGELGHVMAELFGADPKTALDEDLVRLKSLFEQGKTRVHSHTVRREESQHGEPVSR